MTKKKMVCDVFFPVYLYMNTGEKNTKGRAILRGPRGGLYVIGPSGAKLSTFKKATVAAPPRAATPTTSR
jgi:hypothetical protein